MRRGSALVKWGRRGEGRKIERLVGQKDGRERERGREEGGREGEKEGKCHGKMLACVVWSRGERSGGVGGEGAACLAGGEGGWKEGEWWGARGGWGRSGVGHRLGR